MTFEQFYGDEIETDVIEYMRNKPHLLDLEQLICSGHKLTEEDCAEFWRLFKIAQKDAFETGSVEGK